jgi:hypothetical protein
MIRKFGLFFRKLLYALRRFPHQSHALAEESPANRPAARFEAIEAEAGFP